MSHSPSHIPILGPGRVTSECTLCLYLSDGDDEKHYSSSIIGVLAKSELGETGWQLYHTAQSIPTPTFHVWCRWITPLCV